MNEETKILVGGLLMMGALFFGIVVLFDQFSQYQCESYQRISGKETRYNRLDICYVNTEHGWQRWDEYTKRAIASEGLKK